MYIVLTSSKAGGSENARSNIGVYSRANKRRLLAGGLNTTAVYIFNEPLATVHKKQ
jgi:hypothetical protein